MAGSQSLLSGDSMLSPAGYDSVATADGDQDDKPGDPLDCSQGRDGKGSLLGSTFNLINSIIGSGIIGLPYALQQAGFWTGLILLLFVGWLTDYSLRMVVGLGAHLETPDYENIVKHAFGWAGLYTGTSSVCPELSLFALN